MDLTRVSVDIYDSLVVLENLSTPERAPPISTKGYTREIREDEYPTLQRPRNWFKELDTESTKMWGEYAQRVDLTQEEMVWHPAGAGQFGSTNEEMAQAQRVKVKVTIDARLGWWHFLGISAPPGEVITVEVPDKLVNAHDVAIMINCHALGGDCKQNTCPRLPAIKTTQVPVTRKVMKLGWPLGGW